MISIIISTYNDEKYSFIESNIANTIGDIPYELIKIWNPRNLGLSKAYNKGAAESKFEILLFLHDDIEFLVENWGQKLKSKFNANNIGIMGLAGSIKKFKLPTGFDMGIKKYRHIFVKHHINEKIKNKTLNKLEKVKTLDGVFLAMNKDVWKELKFNEQIDGYHFYDLDISLRASGKYQNFVISDIPILHNSMGRFNNSWIKASLKFHNNNYNFDVANKSDLNFVKKYWFNRLKSEDISFPYRIRYLLMMGFNRQVKREAFNFLFPTNKHKKFNGY